MKTALLQITSSDDPAENLATVSAMIREAVAQGAGFVLTPEVTNCVSASRTRQEEVLRMPKDDPFLAAMPALCQELGIWLLIGSLGVKTTDADGRFANRSFLFSPEGTQVAWYDKIHMFDVQVSETETYRESAGYRPGERAVVADAGFARIGLTVCYDVRFPKLHRTLAQAGAQVLTCPAAFSPVTGAAHWESLLRARAIETGCWVLAPAQTGTHAASRGRARSTHGHSLAIAPWGEVVLDMGTEPGIGMVDVDMSAVTSARGKVPSLDHDRPFALDI
ncbi:carbon-nitrogen hydrolase family protein [Pseudooceanicola sp. 216_PA32_1]|uniref:Carbon-nitrogen hydrolase family protein n=1 Tax=Pseudooceanicola pacificus TaxID=2676438 RepID=A0A844W2Q2_9RHOB|nr:carbon-nitrogen hydrolase family protein [Pseudooceanicola pacificus]MWB76974.1 carbon-nitrogen hydrolase family protein [Pseudooceanicola pacificus]